MATYEITRPHGGYWLGDLVEQGRKSSHEDSVVRLVRVAEGSRTGKRLMPKMLVWVSNFHKLASSKGNRVIVDEKDVLATVCAVPDASDAPAKPKTPKADKSGEPNDTGKQGAEGKPGES